MFLRLMLSDLESEAKCATLKLIEHTQDNNMLVFKTQCHQCQ